MKILIQSLRKRYALHLLFLLCIGTAMALYRGGNSITGEHTYSITHNVLSDLGLYVTFVGDHQPLVSLLFLLAMSVAAWLFILSTRTTNLQRCQKVPAYIAAASLVAVPLLPSDVFTWPHRIAVLLFAISAALYLTARALRHRSIITYIGMVASWAFLLFILLVRPPLTTEAKLIAHAVAQKAYLVALLVSLLP